MEVNEDGNMIPHASKKFAYEKPTFENFQETCERACGKWRNVAVCELPAEHGDCQLAIPRYVLLTHFTNGMGSGR